MDTLNSQLVASMAATAVDDGAPVFGLHPLPETMHARTAANFWLISTFG
jgi:hypothetical protein